MERVNFDPFPLFHKLYHSRKRELSFRAKDKREAIQWQKRWREKLISLLGGFPDSSSPLEACILERKEFPLYVRETVVFNSREDNRVFAYLLIPRNISLPAPALICLPGHGRGVDDIVGIKKDGTLRKRPGGYMKDFALQSVTRGFVTLAMEQLGFGHRREEKAIARGPGESSCNPLAGALLLLGETMIGWRVYDVRRAIDFLETRKEVDNHRIGIMGISGGGTIALFSGALEERIKVTVVSGYFCTFYHSIFSLYHCICNYVPGLLQYGEMYDVAGLIPPRALFIEAGKEDPIFPLEGVKDALKKIREIYRILEVENKLGWEIFAGKHEIQGEKSFLFLEKHLTNTPSF